MTAHFSAVYLQLLLLPGKHKKNPNKHIRGGYVFLNPNYRF